MRTYWPILVHLPGADVEVAERVGAVPVARLGLDDAEVFRDGRVDAALPQRFLGALERPSRSNGGTAMASGNRIKQRWWPERASMVRNSRVGPRPPGARRSHTPYVGRTRRGSVVCSVSISRSRVTLATIEAAAMAVARRSPPTMPRCAMSRPGTRKASTRRRPAGGERQNRPLHRQQRCLVDINPIDPARLDADDRPRHGVARNCMENAGPGGGGQGLESASPECAGRDGG